MRNSKKTEKPKDLIDSLLRSKHKLPVKIIREQLDLYEEFEDNFDFVQDYLKWKEIIAVNAKFFWIHEHFSQNPHKNPDFKDLMKRVSQKHENLEKNHFFLHEENSNKNVEKLEKNEEKLKKSERSLEILDSQAKKQDFHIALSPKKPENLKIAETSPDPKPHKIRVFGNINQKNIEKPGLSQNSIENIDNSGFDLGDISKQKRSFFENPWKPTEKHEENRENSDKKEKMYTYHLQQNPYYSNLIRQHTPEQRKAWNNNNNINKSQEIQRNISRTPPRNLIQYQRNLMKSKNETNSNEKPKEKTFEKFQRNEKFQKLRDLEKIQKIQKLNKNQPFNPKSHENIESHIKQQKNEKSFEKNTNLQKDEENLIKTPKKQANNKWLINREMPLPPTEEKEPMYMKLNLDNFKKKTNTSQFPLDSSEEGVLDLSRFKKTPEKQKNLMESQKAEIFKKK